MGCVVSWVGLWREQRAAREQVRTCITRKRIFFCLFKQWYWDSFDNDVQVRWPSAVP